MEHDLYSEFTTEAHNLFFCARFILRVNMKRKNIKYDEWLVVKVYISYITLLFALWCFKYRA